MKVSLIFSEVITEKLLAFQRERKREFNKSKLGKIKSQFSIRAGHGNTCLKQRCTQLKIHPSVLIGYSRVKEKSQA